jgi:predicted DNA-binding protein
VTQIATSLRMPESLAMRLGAIARTDGIPMSEFVREAIEKQIAERLSDEGFKERLKKRIDEDREVWRELGVED